MRSSEPLSLAIEKVRAVPRFIVHRSWSVTLPARLHRLLRLIPLSPLNPLPLGLFLAHFQYLSVLGCSLSTVPEGRLTTRSPPHRLDPYSQAVDRRE